MKNPYRRFVVVNIVGLILSGLLFTWLSRNGTLDFWLEQQFFDPVTRAFPFRDTRQLVYLGHTMLKNVTALGLIVGIVLAVISSWLPRLRPWRGALVTFCLMAGASAWLVQTLKGRSVHACPWDLAVYGGDAQWFPLFNAVKAGVEAGHCWPGGHASGGFAIVAGYFALRQRQPRWARRILILGLALGTIMGAVQMVRGAHFLSHNLWTLWLVWTTCFAIDLLIRGLTFALRRRAELLAAVSADPVGDKYLSDLPHN